MKFETYRKILLSLIIVGGILASILIAFFPMWAILSMKLAGASEEIPCAAPAEIIRVVMDGVEFAIPHEYQPSFNVDSWRDKQKPVQHIFYNPDKTIRLGYCQTAEEPAFDVDYISFSMGNLKSVNYKKNEINFEILSKIVTISLQHTENTSIKYDHFLYEKYDNTKAFDKPAELGCNPDYIIYARTCKIFFGFPQNIRAEIGFNVLVEGEKDKQARENFLHEHEKELAIKEIIKFINSMIVKKENKL
jgi:hypothetical protein